MFVELKQVFKEYGAGTSQSVHALQDIQLSIAKSEFVCLLGPSGCGKSTLLKLISGIEEPTGGEIQIDGSPVKGPSTERGFIFQDYALFPWLTVRGNIRFGMAMKRIPRRRQRELLDQYLMRFGLADSAHLYPKQLSGGMRQRVAIARALCLNPQILLMDEPFAALDAILRQKMQEEVVRIWERENITFVLVTHDVEEAIYMADRIVVMSPRPGRIKETVTVNLPRPRRRTDARFVELRARLLDLLEDEKIRSYPHAVSQTLLQQTATE
ncbi:MULTISPECIES: ABC transporter ATP-binding protein [Paenibacillus]|uniref:Carnitine transport ATP-binding protein OpuCA n=1 Tax=Paenibacillus validus TaxID=44253 RepID=A0A7X2ZFD6_9BACL|nr:MULTISPECIES: ABC transporter ATP-binding protein [Paenibacillus]MUG73892.1 ATP-binding cassette domain-containing protein [Paenibacillus validus]